VKKSDWILIIVGVNIPRTTCHQMTTYLPHPMFASALPSRLVVLESGLGLESGLKSVFAGLGL